MVVGSLLSFRVQNRTSHGSAHSEEGYRFGDALHHGWAACEQVGQCSKGGPKHSTRCSTARSANDDTDEPRLPCHYATRPSGKDPSCSDFARAMA
jgi:hypothetical protein